MGRRTQNTGDRFRLSFFSRQTSGERTTDDRPLTTGVPLILVSRLAPILLALLACLAGLSAGAAPEAGRYFAVEVVDDRTGRGVPVVEVPTVHSGRYFTDSNGIVAPDEPGLAGQEVFFHVSSHGY